MSQATERAEIVGELPHVQKWIKKMQKLAKEMPPEVWVYVASGTPHIMALDEKGKLFERSNGGMDSDAIVATLSRSKGHWDGGDW